MIDYKNRKFDVIQHDDLTNVSLIKKRGNLYEPYVVVRGLNLEKQNWDSGTYYKDEKDAKADFNRRTMDKEVAEIIGKYYGIEEDEKTMEIVHHIVRNFSIDQIINKDVLRETNIELETDKMKQYQHVYHSLDEVIQVLNEGFDWKVERVGVDLEISKQINFGFKNQKVEFEHVFYVETGDTLEETIQQIQEECNQFKGEDLNELLDYLKKEELEKYGIIDEKTMDEAGYQVELEVKKLGGYLKGCIYEENEKHRKDERVF